MSSSNHNKLFEKFKYHDEILKDLMKKCTEVKEKRQKYYDRLLDCDDSILKDNGMCKQKIAQYEPITQKYLLLCFNSFFKNDINAKKCLEYVTSRRQKTNKMTLKSL